MRQFHWLLVTLALACACACGGGGDTGPQPLVADTAVVTGCSPDAVPVGAVRAKLIDCVEELPSGVLVSGRPGDIVMENAQIEVVIRAFGDGLVFPGTRFGGIVDAARLGQEDLVRELLPMMEFNVSSSTEIVITEAGDDGPATVVVRGPAAPVPLLAAALTTQSLPMIIETQYILDPDADHLTIRTALHADESAETPSAQVGEIFFFGGRADNWLPGTGIPEGSGAGELIATSGTTSSYGIAPAADVFGTQLISINSISIALGPTLTVGSGRVVDRQFIVGDGSISSVTDRAWTLRGVDVGTISGTTTAGVEVHVTDAADKPITIARADATGAYSVTVPAGQYTLTAKSPGDAAGPGVAVTVTAGGSHTASPTTAGSGLLSVTTRDADATPLPSRVVITGTDSRIEYTGVTGALELALPPGTYSVDVSRGMEYDAFTVDGLVIVDGVTTDVNAVLTRVVDTAGWIAIDTHLHSEMSLDSGIPLRDRIAAIAAEGVELAVSTDHDYVTDYGPYVEDLGLGDWVAYRTGVETTTLSWGHVNAWPLQARPDLGGGGAFLWYGLSPADTFDLIHAAGSEILIQLNHPRLGVIDFFNILDYNPGTGLAEQDPASIGFPGTDLNDFDFDLIEVANDISDDEFETVFADWLSLVAFGHAATPMGSSDSHGKKRFVGEARTYVYVGAGNDDPKSVSLDAVDAALRQRKVSVSQGAFVTASIEDPSTGQPTALGALVDLSGQSTVSIRVRVQAAPWLPLARVRVFVGQGLATTINLNPADTAVVRYDGVITVPITSKDGFVVVVADPDSDGRPVLANPGPSFTSPLLFDGDGDGAWTAKPRG